MQELVKIVYLEKLVYQNISSIITIEKTVNFIYI